MQNDQIKYNVVNAVPFSDKLPSYIRITDIDDSSHRFVADPLTSPDEPAEERYKLKKQWTKPSMLVFYDEKTLVILPSYP